MRTWAAAGAAVLAAGGAAAGGIEQTVFPVGILFEPGGYAEFSLGRATPDVRGRQAVAIPVPGIGVSPEGAASGDVAADPTLAALALKVALSDRLDLALVVDSPVGADIAYPSGTGYILAGTRARVTSEAATAVLKYRIDPAWSVYGGLRAQRGKGVAALSTGYTVASDRPTDMGLLVGAAFERPAIAMRLSVTYESAIRHRFRALENGQPTAPFTTEVPQALTLNAQTGVAGDTLLFGSLRWRDWSAFEIAPPGLLAATGEALVAYDGDTVTATLGLGRRFSDTWSGAVRLTRNGGMGGLASNLSPVDGYTGLGLGLTYTQGPVKVTGALSYTRFDSIRTRAFAPLPEGSPLSDFRDNEAIGAGLSVAFTF